jgi:copper chaperone CopZ
MPQSFLGNMKIQKVEGSINVRTSVPTGTTNPTYKKMEVDEWVDSKKLKEAIEKSIVQYSVFSQVSQGNADYVLEVWVEKIQNILDIGGEGFVFDLMSIWRLTRVKDGKVVACEFVKGHGGAHGFAARAYPPGISAATRNMIQKGLFAISDQSQSHLSAMSTAGSRTGIPRAD